MDETGETIRVTEQFENPPPIKNYPLYILHVIAKISAIVFFVIGSIIISLVLFPVLKLLFPSPKRFKKAGHHAISVIFRFFIGFMHITGCSALTVDDKKKFRNLKSCIIVANHPSLMDVVMLISLIPNADCMVNGSLGGKKNLLHIIVRQLYIPTFFTYEEMMEKCKESLQEGNCLIIFPEGTRSLASGQHSYKKGAARISLASGCPLIPVYIGGNDKRGLRKNDTVFMFNNQEKYHYIIKMKDEYVYPEAYKDLPEPAAAKRMTKKIHELLCDEANIEFYKNDETRHANA